MKALKSQFAQAILRDPESARNLMRAPLKPGFGPASGVRVTVAPVGEDGVRQAPRDIIMMRVPKADYRA